MRLEIVMVNSMSQHVWTAKCPDIWLIIISGYVCEGISG